MKRTLSAAVGPALGFLAGLVCGLLGAGGGSVLLPLLRRRGLSPPVCHATLLAVTVPLALFSGLLYLWQGRLSPSHLLPFLPGGLAGAAAGSLLLCRLPPLLLRGLFGLFLLWSGLRLVGVFL